MDTDTLATCILGLGLDLDSMADSMITGSTGTDSTETVVSMAAITTDHSRRNWKISSPTPRPAKARRGFLFFVPVEFFV